MPRYLACGLVVASEFPLPELLLAPGQDPQCIFQLRHGPLSHVYPWFHQEVTPAGQVFLALARTAVGYVVRFPGLADFELSAAGTAVQCQPVPDTAPEIYRQLLLGHVLPLLLTLRGQLVLHASGIVTPAGAAVFIGPTGSGKSTLAAGLGRQGHEVLADDCLVLQELEECWHACPSFPVLRLRTDVIGALCPGCPTLAPAPLHPDKRHLRQADDPRLRFAAQAVPVWRFYFLAVPEESTAITIAPPPARAAFLELLKNAFHLDATDAAANGRKFQLLARLAAQPSLRWLAYPRELGALPAVRQAILADATADAYSGRTVKTAGGSAASSGSSFSV